MFYDSFPCSSCDRVKSPDDCMNKNCKVWREWFSEAWDRTVCMPPFKQLRDAGVETVSIGGEKYAHPDRVADYLENNPCDSCTFPRELCTSPCPAKRAWVEIRKEVRE